jgi:hypothetical protein
MRYDSKSREGFLKARKHFTDHCHLHSNLAIQAQTMQVIAFHLEFKGAGSLITRKEYSDSNYITQRLSARLSQIS